MSDEYESFTVQDFQIVKPRERRCSASYGLYFNFQEMTVAPWYLDDRSSKIQDFLKGASLGLLQNEFNLNSEYFSNPEDRTDSDNLYLEYLFGLNYREEYLEKKPFTLEDMIIIEKFLAGNDTTYDPVAFSYVVQDHFNLYPDIYLENEALKNYDSDISFKDFVSQIQLNK